MRKLFQFLVFVLVISMLTAWAFLFEKTQDVDRQAHYDLLDTINHLKRLDTELTRDVILLRLASNNTYDDLGNTLKALEQSNAQLNNKKIEWIYQQPNITASSLKKEDYFTAFRVKQKLIKRFKSSNGVLTNSINFIPISISELILFAREIAPKSNLPKNAKNLLLNTLSFSQFSNPKNKQKVFTAIAILKLQLDTSDSPQINLLAHTAIRHAESIVKFKTDVDIRLNTLATVSTRKTLASLAYEYNLLQEKRLKQIDQYRFLLVVFSAVLLVILAIIGYYLRRSYRKVQIANETLERRVKERTSELSGAYQQLKSSQAHLVQSEKMASLGQMVAGVAHEVNTPLGYVKSNIELIRDSLPEVKEFTQGNIKLLQLLTSEAVDETALGTQIAEMNELREIFQEDDDPVTDIKDFISESLIGIESISELVMGLKNFSRMDRATTDNVNLNDCIDSTLVISKNKIKGSVEVKKNYSEIPAIECSPSQINQVLLNLITNAAQAFDEKTEISKKGVILLKTKMDEHNIYVEVIDNGKGMSKEVMAKIFDPFYTTKPVGEGTGLGLSISYKIIQEHGGTLSVASMEGRGSKFKISLPISRNSEKRVTDE